MQTASLFLSPPDQPGIPRLGVPGWTGSVSGRQDSGQAGLVRGAGTHMCAGQSTPGHGAQVQRARAATQGRGITGTRAHLRVVQQPQFVEPLRGGHGPTRLPPRRAPPVAASSAPPAGCPRPGPGAERAGEVRAGSPAGRLARAPPPPASASRPAPWAVQARAQRGKGRGHGQAGAQSSRSRLLATVLPRVTPAHLL